MPEASQEAEMEEKPTSLSFVIFLNHPRELTQATMLAGVAKGWRLSPEQSAKLKLGQDDHQFTIHYQGTDFLVETASEPWMEDQPQIIEETADLRMREMLRHVTSYLVVTVDNDFKDEDAQQQTVDNALRLLSGFTDAKDTLAIFDDDSGDFNYFNDEVQETLCGEEPESSFAVEVTPPAVTRKPDAPEMQAAISEARRRWPEFAKNFRDYAEERSPFLLQARFGFADKPECLWAEVLSIHANKISALLKSDPSPASSLNKGDTVEIPLSEVLDWIYPEEDSAKVGGFTLDLRF